MADAKAPQVISAARFELSFLAVSGMDAIGFSELGGINSKVTPSEYIFSDKGMTVHTKQFGKTEPPTVTLKRALDQDGNKQIFVWHEMARKGLPSARADCILTVYDAEGDKGKNKIVYHLSEAWCQEITVQGVKAGDTAVSTIEVKLSCNEIIAKDN